MDRQRKFGWWHYRDFFIFMVVSGVSVFVVVLLAGACIGL
jgi:hypothetical protein